MVKQSAPNAKDLMFMSETTFAPIAGVPLRLADDLRLILAPNPSPMTYWGTNTFLLGHKQIAVIDPGPDDNAHLEAIMAAVGAAQVSHIIVTHAHLDHSPLARPLSDLTGAPIYAFGPAHKGRSAIMQQLADQGLAGGGEGIDAAFIPDIVVADGEQINGADWSLTAIHTPGHIGNHICLTWGDAIFTGDHVMGWASSLVSPPDGDLTDFMQSCEKLKSYDARIFYPAHGAPIKQAPDRLNWLIDHRDARTSQILAAIDHQPREIDEITATVYHDVNPALLPAAKRNVFAHLVDLHQRGEITAKPALSTKAKFAKQN